MQPVTLKMGSLRVLLTWIVVVKWKILEKKNLNLEAGVEGEKEV